jgi:putative transposase
VVLTAEQDGSKPLPPTGRAIGIDLGIANLVADSDGGFFANPRFRREVETKLAAAEQRITQRQRSAMERSARQRRALEHVADLHRKVARQRLDHAHKTALDLIRKYDLIAHEDLVITSMVRRPAPRPDPSRDGTFLPNGASAKTGLNRSIADAGWGIFLAVLRGKAESAGREVIAVDPRNTSRRCPDCGHTAKENRITQARFQCLACGFTAHADTVGAVNVLRAGLALREASIASREAVTGGVTLTLTRRGGAHDQRIGRGRAAKGADR